MTNLWNDLRYALRQLGRSPGFAFIAILTLALGIGVNTAIFSIVNQLLFSSRHIQQENRLVVLAYQQKGGSWEPNLSLTEIRELRSQTKNVFSSIIGEQTGLDGLSVKDSKPDRVFTNYVTGDFFQTLGIRPFLGRFFLPSEGETPGADPVMVLTYDYWQKNFDGHPDIIGRLVFLDGHPITIIGVAPRNFRGINPVLGMQEYLPLAMQSTIEKIPLDLLNKRSNRNIDTYARLQPGVTSRQVNSALAVVAHRFATEHPRSEKDLNLRSFPFRITRTGFDPQNTVGVVSTLFLGLAGLVLLLACVNVANLLLVRASVREREMVIRSALGAQRSRLMRQMLTESLLLALFGGAGGVALGVWTSSLLSSIDFHTDLPISFDFGFDWHVFAFSACVALFAGAVVGIVPALRLSRANLNLILREGGRSVSHGGSKFRDALVMLQVGSALMLLIIAGLFTRSLGQATHTDLGFNPSHVLTLSIDPSEIGYNDAQTRDLYSNLLQRVRMLPGIVSATTASAIPMSLVSSGGRDSLSIPGYQEAPGQPASPVDYNLITPGYFHTLQISLLQGRAFTDSDDEQSLHVAIVSKTMAKKFWPDQNPIGKQFVMASDPKHSVVVVGVAGDARYNGVPAPIDPLFYVPFRQHYLQNSLQSVALRTAGDPAAMIPDIERTIHNIAPTLPVFEVKTLRQGVLTGLLIYEIAATIAGVMGALGLILAIVGVYGVLSYVVGRKTNEIGIRMAMGASHGDILKMVYRQGARIVGVGLGLGLLASFGAAHVMHSFIIVSATDPLTYVAVSAILLAIALLACYIPARRAMRVDPMQALREE